METNCQGCGVERLPSNDRTTLNYYGICRDCQRKKDEPRPWVSSDGKMYGCYFPTSDLNVSELGGRGTGQPQGVQWLDKVNREPVNVAE